MRLTAKQKAYVAVAGLAVAALLLDRMMLAPAEASGQTPSAAVAGSTVSDAHSGATAPGGAETQGAASNTMSIAARLQAQATALDLDPMRSADAFAAPSAWQTEATPVGGLGPAERAAERFRQAHTLSAVMTGSASGYAIIDERFLYIGQSLDGFTLVSVDDRTAVLERNGTQVELSVPTNGDDDR